MDDVMGCVIRDEDVMISETQDIKRWLVFSCLHVLNRIHLTG